MCVCVSGGGGEGGVQKLFEQVRDLYLYVHISSESMIYFFSMKASYVL